GDVDFVVSGNVVQIPDANGSAIRFARPGVMSDSWISTGTRFNHAPMTTGTETKPPLEKTTFGFSLRIMRYACSSPPTTLNGSFTLFQSRYRRSFPVEIGQYFTSGSSSTSLRSIPLTEPI